MNLKHLTDDKLLESITRLATQEREILVQVLQHLREIERRRLFAALGFSSLFTYAVGKLGYSEDQAQRRIAAMRLLRDIPELETKVESGALNLTQLGMARAAFQRQAFAQEDKLQLLEKISGKTSREAESLILEQAPLPHQPEKIRAASSATVRMEFTAPNALAEKLERLKGLLAHKYPGISTAQLVELLCDEALEAHSPKAPTAKPSAANVRRQVWARAKCKCTNCGSTYALQRDHRHPRALGGGDELENQRLLCRNCNQRAAIEVFGIAKMEPFLPAAPRAALHPRKRQEPGTG
jgi:hypothetical protein